MSDNFLIVHFRVAFCLGDKTSLPAKPFFVLSALSFSHVKSNSSPYEKFCTRTCFEAEAKCHSNMAYSFPFIFPFDIFQGEYLL